MNKFIEEDIAYDNMALGYLQNILEVKYESITLKDKRSKEYKELKESYNSIAKLYNNKAKSKIYTIIK